MATEREGLLATIRDNPLLDAPRLVYADFLDEYGKGDLDAATVEFIRVSCPLRTTPVMPRAAYKWLDNNWKRLVPSATRLTGARYAERDGRVIWGRTRDTPSSTGLYSSLFGVRFNLHFSRGFLLALEMWSARECQERWIEVRKDQPMAEAWGFLPEGTHGTDRVDLFPHLTLPTLGVPDAAG